MKKKIIIILSVIIVLTIAILAIIFFVNNNKVGKDSQQEENVESEISKMLKEASMLDWNNISTEIEKDSANTNNYNGNKYIVTGQIQKIDTEKNYATILLYKSQGENSISLDDTLNIFFEENSVKKLEKEDVISAIGELNITGEIYDLKNAKLINIDECNEDIYINKITENNRLYFDYQYDNANGLPIAYKIIYYSYTSGGGKYRNEEHHTLKYDNNNLIEEKIIGYEDDEKQLLKNYMNGNTTGTKKFENTTKYTYNADNTLAQVDYYKTGAKYTKDIHESENYTYEKNEENQIIKQIHIDTYGAKITTTYEYNENGLVTTETEEKATKYSSKASTTVYTYEYNQNGQMTSKNERTTLHNYTYTYTYDQKGNLTEIKQDGSIEKTFSYGIVGKKNQ